MVSLYVGLVAGLAVSTFSKTLAFLIGLLVLGTQVRHSLISLQQLELIMAAQYAASKGINIIPTQRVQQYVKGINLRSAIEDNVAFKMSFGATFLLSAFAEF